MNKKDPVFCHDISCQFAHYKQIGDGRNEPLETEFSCSQEDALVKLGYIDFEFDQNLPPCPLYKMKP